MFVASVGFRTDRGDWPTGGCSFRMAVGDRTVRSGRISTIYTADVNITFCFRLWHSVQEMMGRWRLRFFA
jgi:hypothetical protein